MDFDLIVIGAGPGGYVAAIKAAQLGMHVAIVEKAEVGGTCLNRGCIPTKSLLHDAELIRNIKNAANDGIHVADFEINQSEILAKKNQVVNQLVQGVESLLAANQVELILGEAKIVRAGLVKIADKEYTTKNILIATGSVPAIPPIPGSDEVGVITSNELLTQDIDFKRLIIIGGGVIGVECGAIFREFGCEVTIIEMADTLVPNFEGEIGKKLAMQLKKQGISIFTKAAVQKIERDGDLVCTFETKGKMTTVTGDKILMATGRRASYDGLFEGEVFIETARDGIKVNENFETSEAGIYAIGDVVSGSILLAHLASAMGVNCILAMNNKEPEYDLSAVPSCVYTNPEIASVGLNETDATEKNIPVKVAKYNMAGNGKTIISGSTSGFMKVIANEETNEILGAQLMCERATDMISEFATAIVNKLTIEEVLKVIHPHPTYNEAVGEVYENLLGMGIHTMPKRKK